MDYIAAILFESIVLEAVISTPDRLIPLFHRRWTVPTLAALATMDGAKFVTLVSLIGASPGALRLTLDDLMTRRLVARNPGYGHPLRPEYILTKRGARVAERCVDFEDAVERAGAREAARLKWPMPVLFVTGSAPARFAWIAERLGDVTDRALSQSLHTLGDTDLVTRRLVDDRPPTAVYSVTKRGRLLLPTLTRLAEPLSHA